MVVKFKHAFTLIELIFAIVIIGISFMSVPMMIQATSTGVSKNLEVQEAIFKAIVITKSAVGENSFVSVDDVIQGTKIALTDGVGLSDYKYTQKYTLSVTTPATFNGETSNDYKKITTSVYNDSDKLLARFSAYKFNY